MNKETNSILVSAQEMQDRLTAILVNIGFQKEKADKLATAFTQNSVDGIYTHGINRFSRFVDYTRKGFVKPDAEPSLISANHGIEQWDGNLGPGILNAIVSTDRSMKLADEYGIACVALRNTNHWMRGGAFGWQAALAGYVFIGFTNTIANMPAHGAIDSRLGNNPLVIGLPYNETAIVLDMAMSQYSFGKMELAAMKNEMLPIFGGYDKNGKLTTDPKEIMHTGRPLPIGYWKGAGLSLLLDLLATILSAGLSTHEISRRNIEYGLSQVFISINLTNLADHSSIPVLVNNIIDDYKKSVPENEATSILYPGEKVLKNRKHHLENGIPVLKSVWEEILSLRN